jgi:hypothetical protein
METLGWQDVWVLYAATEPKCWPEFHAPTVEILLCRMLLHGANAVRRSHMLPIHAFLFLTMATQPVNPAASRMQGPWIVDTNAQGYSV